MKSVLFLVAICFSLCGCGPRYKEFARYHGDGRSKPVVAWLPVTDHASHFLPWDVGDELSFTIRNQLLNSGSLFLAPQFDTLPLAKEVRARNLIDNDLSFAKPFADEYEYLVLCDLVEHDSIPYKRQSVKPVYPIDGKVKEILQMKLRVRILDLRGKKPRLVLQELIRSNHLVPETTKEVDYNHVVWGSEEYKSTFMALAHRRLARDVARQAEEYIRVSKSRL